MTHATKPAPRPAAACPGPRAGIPAALIGALLLAGCSSGHIGETWQCPLAKGGSCDSVAAADPAVPDPEAAETTVLAEPLWRVRANGTETDCEADCPAGFDPFGWLARLFETERGAGLEGRDGTGDGERGGSASRLPNAESASTEAARTPAAPPSVEPPVAERAPAPLPVPGSGEPVPAPEPGGQAPGPVREGPHMDDLRTGEVVARIWIAPFVDADGVYREAGHVRVVLEPAGWRVE